MAELGQVEEKNHSNNEDLRRPIEVAVELGSLSPLDHGNGSSAGVDDHAAVEPGESKLDLGGDAIELGGRMEVQCESVPGFVEVLGDLVE